jgi:hypothetical protein
MQALGGGLHSPRRQKGSREHLGLNFQRILQGLQAPRSRQPEGLPLRALVTLGNRHDSPFLPTLIQGLKPERGVADAGYDSKENREVVKKAGATVVIAWNQRRKGKPGFRSILKKGRQYLVEQFNSLVKCQILKGCWKHATGLKKKTGQAYAGLISLLTLSLKAVINGEQSLRKVSQCWN